MLNSKKMNGLGLVILCAWLCSCDAAEINSSDKKVSEKDKVEVSRETAIVLIWELQRLYVLCGKLEPENAEILSRQYRDTKLVKFEEFLPIDQNPYVAMVKNSDVYDAAYVKGDPEIKRDALDECKIKYPKQLEELQSQEAALRQALSDKTR